MKLVPIKPEVLKARVIELAYYSKEHLRPLTMTELTHSVWAGLLFEPDNTHRLQHLWLDCRNHIQPRITPKAPVAESFIRDIKQLLVQHGSDHSHPRLNIRLIVDSDLPINVRTKLLKLKKQYPSLSFTTHVKVGRSFYRSWLKKSETRIVLDYTKIPAKQSAPEAKSPIFSPSFKWTMSSDMLTWLTNSELVYSCCHSLRCELFVEPSIEDFADERAMTIELMSFEAKLWALATRSRAQGDPALSKVNLTVVHTKVRIELCYESLQHERMKIERNTVRGSKGIPFSSFYAEFPIT